MDVVLPASTVALACVFAAAAGAKVASRSTFSASVASLGVPSALAPAVAVLVPATELAIAVALVARETARVAAGATVLLLAAFTAVTGLAAARGAPAACDCFGRLEFLSAGRRPLLRNGALCSLAAVVVTKGAGGTGPAFARPASLAAGLVAVTTVALASAALARRASDEEAVAPEGSSVPVPLLTSLDGQPVDLREARTLVVFWSPACPPCGYMTPRLASWEREPPPDVPALVLVSRGGVEANRRSGLQTPIVLDETEELFRAFGVAGRPSAVLVDGGAIASTPIIGAAPILAALGAPA
jgi:Methylamine utilisation protein MauE/AhpC/TSA family